MRFFISPEAFALQAVRFQERRVVLVRMPWGNRGLAVVRIDADQGAEADGGVLDRARHGAGRVLAERDGDDAGCG